MIIMICLITVATLPPFYMILSVLASNNSEDLNVLSLWTTALSSWGTNTRNSCII